ncbi:MAG: carboxypeptidase-like regulatory domain-containing protein [Salinivirgaceae bacterium]|nr:carboxypeptidase-like regulatory domain-containing protein [Salinivirgaceae bacterium]
MKQLIIFVFLLQFSLVLSAQEYLISGTVSDSQTGETLIGANVLYGEGMGTVTNFDGTYKISVPKGDYNLIVSYVGYTKIEKKVSITANTTVNFKMNSEVIDEVIVVADMARQRETPVAFTNILPAQISEELAGKDLPLILNSTPGVYATQQGGGDGDARITIRGFSQNNVGVMIDGIPVNDMENGWVYWSNWFGLDAIQRDMQVQRGLGISKLALPSVGGTINIITKGIDSKQGGSVKQSMDNNGKLQTTVGYTSGLLKNGFGITVAGSYKNGGTYIDETGTKGYFYYFKIDKRWGKHITSLNGFGAPQQHDQRSYKRSIAAYDLDYARELGIDVDAKDDVTGKYLYRPEVNDKGIGYNQHWGVLKRDRYDANAPEEVQNQKINEYHKPQFSIRDTWSVNDKLFIANTAYMSLGKGGGISTKSSIKNNQFIKDPDDPYNTNYLNYGQINFQDIYNTNTKPTIGSPFNLNDTIYQMIDKNYSDTKYFSANYLVENHNEHNWFGFLSSFDYKASSLLAFSGGIDLRSYKGIHYQSVYDLMGGDYAVDRADTRIGDSTQNMYAKEYMKKEGDKIYYYDEGNVRYGGAFGQVEYKTGLLTTFLNLSAAYTGYMKKSIFDQVQSDWKNTPSFTIKGGANYNMNETMNVFVNLGYLSKVRPFKYFYREFSTDFVENTDNEKVKAIELGYSFHSSKISANVNGYYTRWENKPVNPIRAKADGEDVEGIIPGMDARHTGVELDFAYNVLHNLKVQGIVSLGDWIWDKKVDNVEMFPTEGDRDVAVDTISFDTRGIHVGDAAQTQLGASIRYEPIKGLYFSARSTYFARYYSDYTAENSADEDGNPIDSWIIPTYNLVDLHTGYSFSFDSFAKVKFNLRGSITNLFDVAYISDAVNNSTYTQKQFTDFDAKSAEVFFGAPRRYIVSLKMTF